MDEPTKMQLKAEIAGLKGLASGAVAGAAGLQQVAYPISGNIVVIQPLASAGQAIRLQNDCIVKLVGIIEKLLDKV